MKVLISLEGASPQTDIVRNLTPLEFRDLLSKPAWVPVNYLGWRWVQPLMEKYGEDVVVKVLSRHVTSEFKRMKAPIYIPRKEYEND